MPGQRKLLNISIGDLLERAKALLVVRPSMTSSSFPARCRRGGSFRHQPVSIVCQPQDWSATCLTNAAFRIQGKRRWLHINLHIEMQLESILCCRTSDSQLLSATVCSTPNRKFLPARSQNENSLLSYRQGPSMSSVRGRIHIFFNKFSTIIGRASAADSHSSGHSR